MRTVKEWRGKTDNSMPPPSVRLRIFKAHEGRCHLSGVKIRPGDKWDCDHLKALWDGGENRESNLAPALTKYHRVKSAEDQTVQATANRKQRKMLGIRDKSNSWQQTLNGRPIKQKIGGGVVYADTNEPVQAHRRAE